MSSKLAQLETKLTEVEQRASSLVRTQAAATEAALLSKAEALVELAQKAPAERKKDFALEVTEASPTFRDYDTLSKYAIKVFEFCLTRKKQITEFVFLKGSRLFDEAALARS